MAQQLILNDGTILDGDITELGDGITIFVHLYNMSLEAGFFLMRDASKTSRIKSIDYDVEHVYNNYTVIHAINHEFGNCNLTMRKVVSA